jgi:hypothetical protein
MYSSSVSKLNAAPLPVWELDWQDCPVAFRLQGLARHVSVKIPLVFPPSDMPISTPSGQHRFIVHREDAAKVLLLKQEVQEQTERYLETACGRTRLQARYDWDAVVMDSGVTLMRRVNAWGAGALLVLKVAVWNDDRIVRDRTHARYCDLRPVCLGSVRRFTEALAQHQPYSAATAYSAL